MTHMIWSFAVKIDFHTKYEIYCVPKTQRGCYQVGMWRLRSCAFFPHFQFLRNRYVNVALYHIKYLIKCKWNFIFIKKRLSDDLALLHGRPLSFLLQGKRHVAKSLCKDGKSEGEKMKRVDFHPFCATLHSSVTSHTVV